VETLLQAGLNNALSATFLAVVVAGLGRVLVRRPAVLHCLWFLVLLKLVTPPLYEVSIPWPRPIRAVGEATRARIVDCLDREEESVPEALTIEGPVDLTHASIEAMVVELGHDARDIVPQSAPPAFAFAELSDWLRTDWVRLTGTIWLAGTVTTLLLSCWRIRLFQLLLNQARPASEEIQDWVDELSAALGLGRPPGVWWVSGKLSPMLWALGRSPRLIIPIELWKSLDHRQRATLLVHELAHLRRGDHHVRIFELVVTALYWWNPVLWWARRALRDVEEQCCDAWVVWAFPDAAKSYAETLLETLDFLHQSDCVEPLLASGFGKVHHLRKRLTMIMNGNIPRSISLWGALGSLSLAVLLLPFNASWAQKADEPKEVEVILKTVDEPDKSTEGTEGLVVSLKRQGPDNTSDGKPRIRLELKTDGSAVVIEADSIPEAIKKLKKQIDALFSKAPLSTKEDKRWAEALELAIKALGDTAKRVDEAKSSADKARQQIEENKVVIRKLELDKKISAEDAARRSDAKAKDLKGLHQVRVLVEELEGEKLPDDKKAAERNAIRQKVKTLSVEVQQKRVELAAAQKRLSELEHEADPRSNKSVTITKKATTAPLLGVVKPVDPTKHRVEVRLRADDLLLKGQDLTQGGKLPSSDQKRIDELEKKLEKLLDEVASLKKEQKLDTRTKGPDGRPIGAR
jgi:bla regulator protein blaR1